MTYDTLNELEWNRIQRIWDLLEEGEASEALADLDALARERPGHPDVRIVQAAVALERTDALAALDLLEGAERSADPAYFFQLRAAARYELVELEDAREDAQRSLAIREDSPDVHDLLSRIAEHLGDMEAAAEHAAEAEALDPEACPLPLDVDDEAFDAVVVKSLAELPPEVREHLDEWPVVVEPLPSRELLTAERPPLSPDLLGLFVGRHLLDRSHEDVPGTPGAIYLFRRNLLRMCRNEEELEREIRTTVLHEVGHLLGLDEDDLEEWGLA